MSQGAEERIRTITGLAWAIRDATRYWCPSAMLEVAMALTTAKQMLPSHAGEEPRRIIAKAAAAIDGLNDHLGDAGRHRDALEDFLCLYMLLLRRRCPERQFFLC